MDNIFVDMDGNALPSQTLEACQNCYCDCMSCETEIEVDTDEFVTVLGRPSGIKKAFKICVSSSPETITDDEGGLYHGQIREINGQTEMQALYDKVVANVTAGKPIDYEGQE